jgi:pimeloyl-ACP methyl ester carboxylesterase
MKLFYRKYGEGPPLVILHGLYGSSDNWVTVAKSISRDYTVYLPDMRNHGSSPHSDIHDYQSLSSDIHELVNDLGIRKFFLAGHSMGGKAAMAFAMEWPEMLDGLVIADISPFIAVNSGSIEYRQSLIILNTILETDLSSVLTRSDADRLLYRKIQSVKTRGLMMKNLTRTADKRFIWKINASSLLRNLDRIMEGLPRPEEFYPRVTGFPVLFLKAEKSDYLPSEDWNDILKIFPSAELRVIRNSGHWVNSDNPEEVAEAFLTLLYQ